MSLTDSSRAGAELAGVVTFAGSFDADGLVSKLHQAVSGEIAVDGPVVIAHGRGAIHRLDGVLCAFEGRLTNQIALARSLGLAPEVPAGRIVGAAYHRWGQDVVKRLRGEFVFALWDPTRRQGMLACDPLGARTLFLHNTGSRLVFAIDIAGVLRLLPARPDIDDRAAIQWLALGSIIGDRSLYAGVHRLQAGSRLTFDRSGCRQHTYWRPCYRPPLRITPDEAASEVRTLLRDSVAERVRGHERAGILLSGGLDSSMVAAAAREAVPSGEFVGYSMTFPDLPAVDESRLIQMVSEHLGMTSVQMRVRGGSMLAGGIRFLERWGLPTQAPNITFISALQDFAVREGVTLMLDGEGGDELFGTDSFLLGHLVRRGRLPSAWSICGELPGLGEQPTFRARRRAFWKLAVHDAVPIPLRRLRGAFGGSREPSPAWFSESATRTLRQDHDPYDWKRLRAPLWWSHLSHRLTTERERIGVLGGLRQIGAISSLERHHPLLARELLEFVLQVPPEYAFRESLDRAVQRDAIKALLPEVVVRRPGKSFFTPLLRRALLGGELSFVRSLVESPTAEIRRFVDQRALGAQFDMVGTPAEPVSLPLHTWRIAMMECWLRSQADSDFTSSCLSAMPIEPLDVDFAAHAPAAKAHQRQVA